MPTSCSTFRVEILLEAGLDHGLQRADRAVNECEVMPQLLYFILRAALALSINRFKCCKGRSVPLIRLEHKSKPVPFAENLP